jgi:hypothetical protein
MNRDDISLYVMGEYDGDPDALEASLDEADRTALADEARLEVLLRDAGAAATFCPGCGDLAGAARCDACGAAIEPGGYVVEKVLVSNAHGRMYVARDADGKQVALKELAFVQSPSLEVVAAFEREAKFLRALEHAAIPRFVASFEEGTGVHARYYLAQELVSGSSLEGVLENHWFTEAEIRDVAKQVLAVLVYLQSLSPMVIHRDIKPANLIRRADGSIAVVDFGAAHVQGTTAGSTSIGTFGYMPIEQLAGQVDATTDGYALGASLLHLLSRQEPWRVVQSRHLDAINVSPALRAFLAKLVAPEPKDRFANAAAALVGLDAPAPVVVAKRRRYGVPVGWLRPLAFAAAAVALVGTGVGGYALLGPDRESAESHDLVEMRELVDHMCECTDVACAEHLEARMARLGGDEVWSRLRDDAEKNTMLKLGMRAKACRLMAGVPTASLVVHFRGSDTATVFADGNEVQRVRDGDNVALRAGKRKLELRAATGKRCEQTLDLEVHAKAELVCDLAALPPAEHLPAGKSVDLSFKDAPLPDLVHILAEQCGTSLVMPDYIGGKATIELKGVPCDQALEVLLESRGLWYEYHRDSNLLRIAERKHLDRERREAQDRAASGFHDDPLPGNAQTLDIDFKDAPIGDVLKMFASVAKVNIVMPDYIAGKITLRARKLDWNAGLKAILESRELWYRYRENGKVLRIAERKELDREDREARDRGER